MAELQALLDAVDATEWSAEGWQEERARWGELQARIESSLNGVSDRLGQSSATARLLFYFEAHVGEVVNKNQLRGVAGIGEWARRVRELRVEEGYRIVNGASRDGMSLSEYLLESLERDEQLAADWSLAKKVRGQQGSGKDRLLEYLKAVYPRAADMERLGFVAKIQSWPRRMRELSEEGWQVRSSLMDPALDPGDYRLESLIQASGRAREAMKLRGEILERDEYSCCQCGRCPQVDGVRLEVHHLEWVSRGGSNDPSNLQTLCSACHSYQHSVTEGMTRDELENPGCEASYNE